MHNEPHPLDALFADAAKHSVPMSRLCERANIAPTTPSRWKHGKASPSLDKLMELRSALNAIIAEQGEAA